MDNYQKYPAPSGNTCKYVIVQGNDRISVDCQWLYNPSEADLLGFNRYIERQIIRREDGEVVLIEEANFGHELKEDEKQKAIKEYLETGKHELLERSGILVKKVKSN